MNADEMSRYITGTFEGVDVVDGEETSGNSFFFYNPDLTVPPDHNFPIMTIVTSDAYDQFSNLDRPSVFRLNIGISKETFRSLFGKPKLPSDRENEAESVDNNSGDGTYDFTVLDQVMPHPVYGRMYWVCVLSPSDDTFETKVRPLLDEAYKMAVSKYDRQAARKREKSQSPA